MGHILVQCICLQSLIIWVLKLWRGINQSKPGDISSDEIFVCVETQTNITQLPLVRSVINMMYPSLLQNKNNNTVQCMFPCNASFPVKSAVCSLFCGLHSRASGFWKSWNLWFYKSRALPTVPSSILTGNYRFYWTEVESNVHWFDLNQSGTVFWYRHFYNIS